MNNFAFNLTLTFLLLRLIRRQGVSHIFGILIMLHYNYIATGKTFVMTNING